MSALDPALALTCLFGWDWGASYRTTWLDSWELPLLALFLVIGGSTPRVTSGRGAVILLRWILTVACIALGGAWMLIVGSVPIYRAQYDVGGIGIRALIYGLALYLLTPRALVTGGGRMTSNLASHRDGRETVRAAHAPARGLLR